MKRCCIIAFLTLFFLFPTVPSIASGHHNSGASGLGANIAARLWPNVSVGDNRFRVKLFAYIPESAKYKLHSRPYPVEISQKCSAVIIFPGGSYCYLGIRPEGYDIAELFKSRGIAAFVLRYRTGMYGNHYPDAYEDYKKAVDYIKENVRSGLWNIDTTKIGVIGFSAGGHIAGCAALEKNSMYRAAFAGMIYPVVSMNKPWSNRKSERNFSHGAGYLFNSVTTRDAELLDAYSLEDKVYTGMAPVFIMQCKDDKTVSVKNSITFIEKLKEQKVPRCEWHIYERGGHGFGLYPKDGSDAAGWSELFLNWLKNNNF